MTRTPIGMLIAKIHFHCPVSTSAPPMSGPKALAAPPMPIIAATAFVRLAESSGEKASDSSGVAVPKTNAPPAPWRARKAMRPASEPVMIQPMDAARSDDVREARSGEHEGREGQRVGVDDPLGAGQGQPEILADGGEGDEDDRDVQRHHDGGDRGDTETPADDAPGRPVGVGLGLDLPVPSRASSAGPCAGCGSHSSHCIGGERGCGGTVVTEVSFSPMQPHAAPCSPRHDGTPASVRDGQARGFRDPLTGRCGSETAEQQVEQIADNSNETRNETHVVFLLRKIG